MPGYQAGRPPRNKGIGYPADPPTVDEIVAVMRHTGEDRHGFRRCAMIVVLWRAGLRIRVALAVAEHDLDPRRGPALVRGGKERAPPRGRQWTSAPGSSCAHG
jgi:site-specific recombinase XerD